jgi:hypothetical protein
MTARRASMIHVVSRFLHCDLTIFDGMHSYVDFSSSIIFGQEFQDYVEGGTGSDDIVGGHSTRHGKDEGMYTYLLTHDSMMTATTTHSYYYLLSLIPLRVGDILHGNSGDDVILGDNGQIIRDIVSFETFPWMTSVVWRKYEEPFEEYVVRSVRRYDDIDFVEGNGECTLLLLIIFIRLYLADVGVELLDIFLQYYLSVCVSIPAR